MLVTGYHNYYIQILNYYVIVVCISIYMIKDERQFFTTDLRKDGAFGGTRTPGVCIRLYKSRAVAAEPQRHSIYISIYLAIGVFPVILITIIY
jgi:hypothetical protein